MANIVRGRYTADIDGDFLVVLVGVRPNKLWKVHKWWPVFASGLRMVKRLFADPDSGFLGASGGFINGGPAILQYWRSFEDLERFARDPEDLHLPAWESFNREIAASGDVAIWQETYKVRAGEFETLYVNMPEVGLATAGRHLPITEGGQSAALRLGVRTEDEVPVPLYEYPDL